MSPQASRTAWDLCNRVEKDNPDKNFTTGDCNNESSLHYLPPIEAGKFCFFLVYTRPEFEAEQVRERLIAVATLPPD